MVAVGSKVLMAGLSLILLSSNAYANADAGVFIRHYGLEASLPLGAHQVLNDLLELGEKDCGAKLTVLKVTVSNMNKKSVLQVRFDKESDLIEHLYNTGSETFGFAPKPPWIFCQNFKNLELFFPEDNEASDIYIEEVTGYFER